MTNPLIEYLNLKATEYVEKWTPQLRWKLTQAFLGSCQEAVEQNAPAACLAKQRRLLAGIAQHQRRQRQS